MSENNSPETLDRALDAALTRIADEPVEFDVAAGKLALQQALRERAATPPPVRKRTRWLAAAAVVTVLTAGGLAASTFDTGSGPSATAAEELIRAADLAARVTPRPLAPGQYLYVRSRYQGITVEIGSNKAWTSGATNEEWVPADHRDEWQLKISDTGPTEWLPGHEGDGKPDSGPFKDNQEFRAKCGMYSYFAEGYPDRCTVGSFHNPTPEFIASLPTDPRGLYEKLKAEGGTGDAGVLMGAGEALRSGRMPADVRANIFRALALLPGLVVTEKRANLDGQEGVALGIKYYEDFEEIIINPDNGEFIGRRSTVAEEGTLEKGTVRSVNSVSTAVVSSLGARP